MNGRGWRKRVGGGKATRGSKCSEEVFFFGKESEKNVAVVERVVPVISVEERRTYNPIL